MSTGAWRGPAAAGGRSLSVPPPRTASPPVVRPVPVPPASTSAPSVGRRRTPAQVVALLQHADELLTLGHPVMAVIDAIGVSEATFHRWRAQYGGIKAEDARRLRELELENRDLTSLVANQSLDILMLRQALSVDVLGPRLRSSIVTALRAKFDVSERRACEVIGQPRSSQRRMAESSCDVDDLGRSSDGGLQLDDPDDELDYAQLVAAYPNATEAPPTPTTSWRPR